MIPPHVAALATVAGEKRIAFLRRTAPNTGTSYQERLDLAFAQEQARAEMVEANQNLRKAQGFIAQRSPPPWPAAARATFQHH